MIIKKSLYDNTLNLLDIFSKTIKLNLPSIINNYQKYLYIRDNENLTYIVSFENKLDEIISITIKNNKDELIMELSHNYTSHIVKLFINNTYENEITTNLNNIDIDSICDEITIELEYMTDEYENIKINSYMEFREKIYDLIKTLEFKFLETDKSTHQKLTGFTDNEFSYIIENKDSLSEYSINIQTTVFNNTPQIFIDIYNIDNKILEYTGKIIENKFNLSEIGYSLNTLNDENWSIIYSLIFININKILNELCT